MSYKGERETGKSETLSERALKSHESQLRPSINAERADNECNVVNGTEINSLPHYRRAEKPHRNDTELTLPPGV